SRSASRNSRNQNTTSSGGSIPSRLDESSKPGKDGATMECVRDSSSCPSVHTLPSVSCSQRIGSPEPACRTRVSRPPMSCSRSTGTQRFGRRRFVVVHVDITQRRHDFVRELLHAFARQLLRH